MRRKAHLGKSMTGRKITGLGNAERVIDLDLIKLDVVSYPQNKCPTLVAAVDRKSGRILWFGMTFDPYPLHDNDILAGLRELAGRQRRLFEPTHKLAKDELGRYGTVCEKEEIPWQGVHHQQNRN